MEYTRSWHVFLVRAVFLFVISPFPFNLLTPVRLILQVQVVIK